MNFLHRRYPKQPLFLLILSTSFIFGICGTVAGYGMVSVVCGVLALSLAGIAFARPVLLGSIAALFLFLYLISSPGAVQERFAMFLQGLFK